MQEKLGLPSTGVFELPGEPAVLINGVPDLLPSDDTPTVCDTSDRGTVIGSWLEGREVRKLFGDQFYAGIVTKFDKETGWYRVDYTDGDFEDLEWHELEEILLPVDVTVPIKTLAMRMIKKRQKDLESYHSRSVTGSRKQSYRARVKQME